jgi:hypothetical protein
MKRWILALYAGAMLATPAMAYPYRRVVWVPPPRPVVVVRVDPWDVRYHPDPRPGWHWVPGHYGPYGRWIPGYWEPDGKEAGYVWVPGHWVGPTYVEGYWRQTARSGWVWVDGQYDRGGNWIPGYWAPSGGAPPPGAASPDAQPDAPPSDDPPQEIHHDYE